MIYLFNAQGQPVPVDDRDAVDALKGMGSYEAQKLFLPKGVVNFRDAKTGELFGLDSKHAKTAFAQGHRLETWEEAQERRAKADLGPLAGPAAFASGALQGATLGLGEFALTKLGLVDHKTLAQLHQGFPGVSATGEITGAVGGALLSRRVPTPAGMASLAGHGISKAGTEIILKGLAKKGIERTAAKAALAKITASVPAGMAEGALFSAGGALTEHNIGEADELGEALVGHIGPGALLGAIAAPAGTAIGSLIGASARATGRKLLSMEEGLQDSAVVDAIQSATGKSRSSVANALARRGDDHMNRLNTALFRGGAVPEADGTFGPLIRGGESREVLSKRIMDTADYWGKTLKALRQTAEDKGIFIPGRALGARVSEVAEAGAPRVKVSGKIKKWHTKLTKKLPREWESHGDINPIDLQDIKQQLDDEISASIRTGKGTLKKLLSRTRKEISDIQDEVMKKGLSPEEYITYTQAKGAYSLIADLRDLAVGGRLAKATEGAFGRIANYALHRAGWQLMGAGLGNVGRILMKGGAMFGAGKAMSAYGGAAGPALLRHQIANVMTLQQANKMAGWKITKAINAFLEGGKVGALPAAATILSNFSGKKSKQEAYRDSISRIRHWQANAEQVATSLTANLSVLARTAPDSTKEAIMTAARVKDFLAAEAPGDKPSLQPDLEDPTAPADIRSLEQKLAGATDPFGSIEDFGNLALSYSQAKAFMAVYPALARKLEIQIRDAVAGHKKKLTYSQRFQLSVFLGQPIDYALTPQALAMVQSVFGEQQEPRPPPAKGAEGLDKLGQAQMGAAQRMAMPV